MVPENGRAEIHYPQPIDNTGQDKAAEGALQGITEHKKGGLAMARSVLFYKRHDVCRLIDSYPNR
ncbi:MAG: hypothetical protein V2I56_12385 [Desulfobacteraceae bacterium]|nr:hypothetical protein [Desulfobacteraceae bacterium]